MLLGLYLQYFDLDRHVTERLGDLTLWALDRNLSRLDLDGDLCNTKRGFSYYFVRSGLVHLLSSSGILTKSSLRITLMLLISSFINK